VEVLNREERSSSGLNEPTRPTAARPGTGPRAGSFNSSHFKVSG
jgi:hypothetical protein